METPDPAARLARNVSLYPWYAGLFNALFWMPVFFLFFKQRFDLVQVLQLEAVYYAAVVLLEVPSGYFSDRVGRKMTLLISACGAVGAHALFLAGDSSFSMFALAQVLLAVSMSFNSGTDTSLHYESLQALDRTSEYDDREAIASRNGFFASAVAALIGGMVGWFDLSYAYWFSLAAGGALVAMVIGFVEPTVYDENHERPHRHFLAQLREATRYIGQPVLRWLFAFAVAMTLLNHVPYEFYQPYLNVLAHGSAQVADAATQGDTPSAAAEIVEDILPVTAPMSGLHMAVTMLIGSWFAARSIRLRNKLGIAKALLLATLLQTIIIGTMGLILHWAVVGLLLLRSTPRALMTAPLNAAIAPRVDPSVRATYLSLQSLAGRLAFSLFLLAMSAIVGQHDATTWDNISLLCRISAGVALACLLLLALSSHQAHTFESEYTQND